MMRTRYWDLPIGRLLSAAALVFGAGGLITGMRGDAASMAWYYAAAVPAICAGAVLIDELRLQDTPDEDNTDAWLGTICLLGALAAGGAGFVLGLMRSSYAATWSIEGIVLAILAVGATVDEFRLLRLGRVDLASAIALTLAVTSFALGFIGFMLGIVRQPTSLSVLLAAIITGITAVSALFEADHRMACERRRTVSPPRHRPREHTTATD